MVCNLLVGVGFTCLVYMWMARLDEQGITLSTPEIPELFVLTFMYDIITRCFTSDVQIWAVIAFAVIVFAGLTSMVIYYLYHNYLQKYSNDSNKIYLSCF